MDTTRRTTLYEGSEIREATGDAIRPGGLTLTERALSLGHFPAGAKVLDVGCGVGATVEHLINHHQLTAVGVDPSPLLLESGRARRPDLPLIEAAGENLPFIDGAMDGVFAECTLSVMENADQALAEFFRVLKSGGQLVVSDLYARNPEGVGDLRQLPMNSCLTGAMAKQELLDKLEAHGFEVVLWEDHSRLLAELTAQLIFSSGSLEIFWGQATCGTVDCLDVRQAASRSRPGYFLLLARKKVNSGEAVGHDE